MLIFKLTPLTSAAKKNEKLVNLTLCSTVLIMNVLYQVQNSKIVYRLKSIKLAKEIPETGKGSSVNDFRFFNDFSDLKKIDQLYVIQIGKLELNL